MTDQTPPLDRPFELATPARPWARLLAAAHWWWLLPLLGVAMLGTLVVGMALTHVVDDDPTYAPGAVAPSQSRATAMAAGLVFREVDQHKWTANDPVFQFGWWLDNMPSFQQGIVAATARYARAMADAAERGSGAVPELEHAAGLLKYPGTVWKFDPSTSWAPTASSEKQYRNAARNLVEYNQRLATGDAHLDRRPEALQFLAAALGKDLAAASGVIDRHLAEGHSALLDSGADNVFYLTKGKVYAYALIVRELGADYAPVLAERDLAPAWAQMVESLKAAAALEPMVVLNGAPDGSLVPSHLTAQGFFLLRARAQLSELAEQLGR